jgi:hypothetical protein
VEILSRFVEESGSQSDSAVHLQNDDPNTNGGNMRTRLAGILARSEAE